MTLSNKPRWELTSFGLHLLAMGLMLCDHLGATVIPTQTDWMTCLGRLAFPIFAFMTVEGFFHTRSRKRYAGRLLLFALLSEIPFNLMMSGSFFYPFHQNVLWCFLLCLGLMQLNEMARSTGKLWLRILTAVGTVLLGTVAGMVSMMDYMHFGVWTVLCFYFLRGEGWWRRAAQLLLLFLIQDRVGGIAYEWEMLGRTFFFSKQWLAVLALIPIWLYRGRQGHHSRAFQLVCYLFYPLHTLLLGLAVRYL